MSVRQDDLTRAAPPVSGIPGAPDWGNRHEVLCPACEREAIASVVAYAAQRITRLPRLRLLVPSEGTLEWGGVPDLVEISVQTISSPMVA